MWETECFIIQDTQVSPDTGSSIWVLTQTRIRFSLEMKGWNTSDRERTTRIPAETVCRKASHSVLLQPWRQRWEVQGMRRPVRMGVAGYCNVRGATPLPVSRESVIPAECRLVKSEEWWTYRPPHSLDQQMVFTVLINLFLQWLLALVTLFK